MEPLRVLCWLCLGAAGRRPEAVRVGGVPSLVAPTLPPGTVATLRSPGHHQARLSGASRLHGIGEEGDFAAATSERPAEPSGH